MGPALGDLLQEVIDVSQLSQQRRQSGAAAAVCEKLTESLVASLQLSASSATKLYAAVEAATFSDEEKQLVSALDAAVGADEVKAPSAAAVKQQMLESLQVECEAHRGQQESRVLQVYGIGRPRNVPDPGIFLACGGPAG